MESPLCLLCRGLMHRLERLVSSVPETVRQSQQPQQHTTRGDTWLQHRASVSAASTTHAETRGSNTEPPQLILIRDERERETSR